MQQMKLGTARPLVLFIVSYFARFPHLGGAMAEHFVGFYNTFSELFSSEYDSYWYDEERMELHKFAAGRYEVTNSRFLPLIMLRFFGDCLKRRRRLLVVTPYPYAFSKLPFFLFAFFLYALKVIGPVEIIVDVIDVPAYSGRETGKWKARPFAIHETACFNIASRLIVNSEGLREYFLGKNVKGKKMCVISDGSFHHLIKPRTKSHPDFFNVLYSGNLSLERGIKDLMQCVERVRKRGYDVRLLFTSGGSGARARVDWPDSEWLQVFTSLPYLDFVEVISNADACVVPYPPKSYWDKTFLSKLSVYMATGKPILSTNLPETRRILRKWNCGLVANNWGQMEELIIRLFEDRELALSLGKNARIAAEKVYNWEEGAKALNSLFNDVLSKSN